MALKSNALRLTLTCQAAGIALWPSLPVMAQINTSGAVPRAETSNTTILPTDVVPLAGAQERTNFGENLQLRIMQRLPAQFYFSSSFELTERYETNPFQFPRKRKIIGQLPPPPVIRTLDSFNQARLNDIIGLANNDDCVFRLLPNASGGWTLGPHTRLFTNYFMIRDQLSHNNRLNTIIHSWGGGLQQDFPVGSRGSCQIELQGRELWQLHQQSVFDYLPGVTFSYILNPKTVLFVNSLIQMRGKTPFVAPIKEIDPFYTWGALHQRNGWTFTASGTFVQNFRHQFRAQATIPKNNYVIICDFEIARRILKAYPGLQAFVRMEPIYNFHSHGVPGLSGMDFRAFFGFRFAMAKPALTNTLRQIREQLEETETTTPTTKPGKGGTKPSAYEMPQPHELIAHNPQPIHGFLAKSGQDETETAFNPDGDGESPTLIAEGEEGQSNGVASDEAVPGTSSTSIASSIEEQEAESGEAAQPEVTQTAEATPAAPPTQDSETQEVASSAEGAATTSTPSDISKANALDSVLAMAVGQVNTSGVSIDQLNKSIDHSSATSQDPPVAAAPAAVAVVTDVESDEDSDTEEHIPAPSSPDAPRPVATNGTTKLAMAPLPQGSLFNIPTASKMPVARAPQLSGKAPLLPNIAAPTNKTTQNLPGVSRLHAGNATPLPPGVKGKGATVPQNIMPNLPTQSISGSLGGGGSFVPTPLNRTETTGGPDLTPITRTESVSSSPTPIEMAGNVRGQAPTPVMPKMQDNFIPARVRPAQETVISKTPEPVSTHAASKVRPAQETAISKTPEPANTPAASKVRPTQETAISKAPDPTSSATVNGDDEFGLRSSLRTITMKSERKKKKSADGESAPVDTAFQPGGFAPVALPAQPVVRSQPATPPPTKVAEEPAVQIARLPESIEPFKAPVIPSTPPAPPVAAASVKPQIAIPQVKIAAPPVTIAPATAIKPSSSKPVIAGKAPKREPEVVEMPLAVSELGDDISSPKVALLCFNNAPPPVIDEIIPGEELEPASYEKPMIWTQGKTPQQTPSEKAVYKQLNKKFTKDDANRSSMRIIPPLPSISTNKNNPLKDSGFEIKTPIIHVH